jgi:hypothetical protein
MNLNTVDSVPRRFDPVTATPAVDPVQEDGRTRRRHAAEDDDRQRLRQTHGNERSEREFKQQRHALVEGVVTAFFPQGTGVPASTEASATGTDGGDGSTQAVSETHPADQNLEKAIMRFVHAVFDTLRDYESAKAESGSGGSGGGVSGVGGSSGSGSGGSQTPLSDGLAAMARDYAAAGQAAAGAAASATGAAATAASPAAAAHAQGHGQGHGHAGGQASAATAGAKASAASASGGAALPEKPEIPDPRLASTYAEVVQALRSGANTSSDVRVELAALLQRLAQALRGDQGGNRSIPAVGSLVSTRV